MLQQSFELAPGKNEKGFIRPIRLAVRHSCGSETLIGRELARSFARKPEFRKAIFCKGCLDHFAVSEFTWVPDGTEVGK